MQGPARTQDHAQIDIPRRRDDTLGEHEPDLLGQRILNDLQDLLARTRLRPVLQDRRRRVLHVLLPRLVLAPDFGDTLVDQALKVRRDVEALTVSLVKGLCHMLRHRQPHHGQQGERRHGQAHGNQGRISGFGIGAVVEGSLDFGHEPQQHPIDHESGRVRGEHGRLAQPGRQSER